MLWVHHTSICSLLWSVMLGEFTQLSCGSMKKGVGRYTEKISTHPWMCSGSSQAAWPPQQKGWWASLETTGGACACSAAALCSSLLSARCFSSPKGAVAIETWSRGCMYWVSGQSHHYREIFNSKVWKSPSHNILHATGLPCSCCWQPHMVWRCCVPRLLQAHWLLENSQVFVSSGPEMESSCFAVVQIAGFIAFPICASRGFKHSCFLKCHSSDLSAASSRYFLIWGSLCGLLPADSDPVAEHGISAGAASAEGGMEWVSSGEGLSLGRKKTSISGRKKLLSLIRAHESLNLPFWICLFSSLADTSGKTWEKKWRVPHTRDYLVTARHREG